MEIKALIFSPALIEIALIGICIVVSLGILFYEIYQIIKNFIQSKIIRKTQNDNNLDNTKIT